MALEYDFRENPNPKNDGEKQPLHPRVVSKGTVSTEKLLEDLAYATSFTAGDLEGVLVSLAERMAGYLKEGYDVELRGIGYFSVRLKARPIMDKKEIKAASISFDTINFRAAASFKRKTQGEIRRAKNGFMVSSVITNEECKLRLEKYLDTHPFITRKEYSALTGLLKGKALESLNNWVEEGYLSKRGKGTHIVYIRNRME